MAFDNDRSFLPADQAFTVIAEHIIHELCIDPEDTIGDWASYPDIGEHDWAEVLLRVQRLTKAPNELAYEDAYGFLASRADSDA